MYLDSLEEYLRRAANNRELVRGYVVANVDPERKSRVKVSIPDVSDKIKEEHLPWYTVLQQAENTTTRVPIVGARVLVRYIDIYNAIVIGSDARRA